MITKYIGSALDFVNTNKIALVYVANDGILLEELIPQYTLNSSYFESVHTIDKNADGEFYMEVTEDFLFNNIVMYSNDGTPLGFTNLTQIISTAEYHIETIRIDFEFTIINNQYVIDINFINYSQHIAETKIVHKKLFDIPQRNCKTLDKISIDALTSKRTVFTNNLFDLTRDANLVHRYSGNLSKGFSRIESDEWVIDEGDKDFLVDFFNIEGSIYLICQNQNLLTIYKDRSSVPKTIQLDFIPEVIGTNMILGNGKLYPTEEIISNKIEPLNSLGNYKTVLDPITKELLIYRFDNLLGVVPISKKLERIFLHLNVEDIVYDLMYATEGLVVYYDNESLSTKLLTYYQKEPFEIQGQIENISFLTNNLFVFEKKNDSYGNKYIYEIRQKHNDLTYEGKSFILGNNGRYRKLDMLSKQMDYKVREIDLLKITNEGCMWKLKFDGEYKIARL